MWTSVPPCCAAFLAGTIQSLRPLTPTLSPRGGERERFSRTPRWSLVGDYVAVAAFPLPIRWGEGKGEGLVAFNCMVVVKTVSAVVTDLHPNNLHSTFRKASCAVVCAATSTSTIVAPLFV